MSRKKRVHTVPGVELVRKLAAEGDRVFTTERARELAPDAGLSEGYLRQALHHLARSGWLVRLRKGLYALSSTVPGVTPAHEFEVAMALVSPAAISHWSALHYHGLTEQAPRKVFVLTTTDASVPRVRSTAVKRISNGYPIGDTVYQFVQVKPERYFGVEKVWIGEARVRVTDPERTLLDGLSMPQYCGDFAEVLHAFEVRGKHLDLERIVRYACQLDTATAKRLGWILQLQGIDPGRLEPLLRLPIVGYRKLDPTGPRKGPCNRHWMIQENLPGKVKA
jgi:predicted transcriptional regulator of viral defense system